MSAVTQLTVDVGTSAACRALHVSRASYYGDRRKASAPAVAAPRPSPARALRPAEREAVLARLHEERFQDHSPAAVYATLLDEGEYLCSISSMHRLLKPRGESRERRDQLTHPLYKKPELMATAPNQLWSWDITKLLGPARWTYFYLYVILDIFSRYVTGWMVAMRESAELAKRLIEESCVKQNIPPGQLTLHADRGSSMNSKPVAFLLADLGVTKTHSRPHVSNDNPYSESQFRTLKYRPEFPDRFGCIQDSRAFSQGFFRWYNEEHRHSGLGLLCVRLHVCTLQSAVMPAIEQFACPCCGRLTAGSRTLMPIVRKWQNIRCGGPHRNFRLELRALDERPLSGGPTGRAPP
jgi:putative transposase